MKNIFGELLETEHINAADLMGLDDERTMAELIGELDKMHPLERHRTVGKLFTPKIPSQGSRAEFENHLSELPEHIIEQLMENKLRLADMLIYAFKPLTGKVTKMFRDPDIRQVGICNLSKSRLPKNMALLVSGIYLLQGQALSHSIEDMKVVSLGSIEPIGAIVNGEASFKVNKKDLITPGIANRNFIGGYGRSPIGYYKLDNPRLIPDDTEIELDIELGTMTGVPAGTVLFAGLHGTATIP